MSEELETNECSSCKGELQNLGVLGKLLISRCRNCGLEHNTKVSEASLDTFISSKKVNTLHECISCNARYAAVSDPDLCPDCHASFLGKTAANDHTEVEMSAPVNCNFCDEEGKQVQASYDGRTKVGSWAYMCEDHFNEHGVGLGLGHGQRLKFKSKKTKKKNLPALNQDLGKTIPEEFPIIKREPVYTEPIEAPPVEQPEPETPEPIETPEEDPIIVPDFPPEEWPEEAPVEPSPPVKKPEKVPVGVRHAAPLKTDEICSHGVCLQKATKAHPNRGYENIQPLRYCDSHSCSNCFDLTEPGEDS